MRHLLPFFLSTLALGSLGTVAVTMASTTSDISEMHLAQKLSCENAQTQSEINRCAQLSYQNADKKLNQLYKQFLPRLQGSRRQKMIAAQQAWIKFRDASCDFERSEFASGSIAPTIYFGCLEKNTIQQTTQLEEYLETSR